MGMLSEKLLRTLILSKVGPFRDYESLEKMASKKPGIPKRIQFENDDGTWIKRAA
jgi:hypothetical protein